MDPFSTISFIKNNLFTSKLLATSKYLFSIALTPLCTEIHVGKKQVQASREILDISPIPNQTKNSGTSANGGMNLRKLDIWPTVLSHLVKSLSNL